jgi:hypothetical protein
MAPHLWSQLAADAGEASLEEMVELVLDADRPVSFGLMDAEDYNEVLKLDNELVNGWARKALGPYAR